MPIVHPEDLVGRIFGVTQEDGQSSQVCIVEAIRDHQDHVDNSSTNVKFRCSINNDAYEDILSYNQILEYMIKDDDADIIWKFKDIIGHKGPLKKGHNEFKGSPYNVTVLWENGETSDEPLSVIAADDPVSCALYARDNDLLDLPIGGDSEPLPRDRRISSGLPTLPKFENLALEPNINMGMRFQEISGML